MTEENKPITKEDLQSLPAFVQRYLRFAGVVGKPHIRKASIRQEGLLRTQPEQAWAPLTTVENYWVNPPAFEWQGKTTPLPMVKITSRDQFIDGKGHLQVKLLSLLKVADLAGVEVDEIAALRFLSAMAWFPTAFLEDYVRWEPMEEGKARVMVNVYDIHISGTCYFGDDGELVRITAMRYRKMKDGYEKSEWSTLFGAYKQINDFSIPTESGSLWHLGEDDFRYIRVRLLDVQYNFSGSL